MKRFYLLFAVIVLLTGCQKTENSASIADGNGSSANLMPMPTQQILDALGAENTDVTNDGTVNHLLPDSLFIVYAQPKRLLESAVGKNNEPILASILSNAVTMVFRPNKIDRLVVSFGTPAQVPITRADPQKPEAAPQTQIMPVARRSVVIHFDSPVTRQMILLPFIGDAANDENQINTLKRGEGKYEYYDVTPPQRNVPQKICIGLINERTVVLVEGQSDDMKTVFSDTPKNSAALQRLKRTNVADSELTIIATLEGLPRTAQEDVRLVLSQYPILPENLVTSAAEHLRALTLSASITSDVGKPVVSVRAEAKSEDGAKEIHSAAQGWFINAQTTIAALDDEAKKTYWIPADFATSLLGAVQLSTDQTVVTASLNNFETLIPSVTSALHQQQQMAQEAQTQQQRIQQLVLLSRVCANYVSQNQKYPSDICSPDGKPLLSWRVALLPTLGLNDLYKQFKLDEPWDSPTNLPLLSQMPQIFIPMIPSVAPPKTVVRFFNSPGTLFANPNLKPEDVKLPQTSLLYVSVTPQYAVEWTKPDKLVFDSEKLPEIVGGVLVGVTVSGQTAAAPLPPKSDANYDAVMKDIDALVKGLPFMGGE